SRRAIIPPMNTQPVTGDPQDRRGPRGRQNQISLQQVIDVLKALPASKLPSAYDYLRFLQQQAEPDNWPFDATPAEMAADDSAWDELLATEASQQFMARAVAEVRAQTAKEQTTPLVDLLDEDDKEDQAGQREIPH
ncbi:MAG: hypothetical protein M1546_08305, partial [Chloroflexi bacterium]|nr:hypothetical protein [Chloroflexota bacterium]